MFFYIVPTTKVYIVENPEQWTVNVNNVIKSAIVLLHTASKWSCEINSMNQHFWLQNIFNLYHKNNQKCHFPACMKPFTNQPAPVWLVKFWFIELNLRLVSEVVCTQLLLSQWSHLLSWRDSWPNWTMYMQMHLGQ